ncbi:MAG: NfeD family protein [Alistipes sp.]|nr:NfeD family protein [Alistipes sp.]
MFFIILLIFFGLLFLIAELVLLPGISIAALLSLVCYGSSVYLAFRDYDSSTGCIVVGAILVLSLVAVIVSLRAKTWQRFSLEQKIPASSMPEPEKELQLGVRGKSVSRLSPMGKVEIGGRTYEAKSQDVYIDPRSEVEVVGFENFSVIVRKIEK